MLPVKSIRLAIGALLAADADTLAPAADANKVALVKAAFTPSENLVIGDLTLADFEGSDPLEAALNEQQVGIDPATGQQIVTIKEPAGGWRWEVSGTDDLPQTIYGFALINQAGDALLGVELFPVPIPLGEVGEEINIGAVKLTINPQPIA